jgi:hypothetical protein
LLSTAPIAAPHKKKNPASTCFAVQFFKIWQSVGESYPCYQDENLEIQALDEHRVIVIIFTIKGRENPKPTVVIQVRNQDRS